MAGWRRAPTLVLALAGPPALAILSRRVLGSSAPIGSLLVLDTILWTLLAVVLLDVARAEPESLASIGLRRPRLSSLGWMLLLVLATSFVLAPAVAWVVERSGLPGYGSGLRRLLELPIGYRVWLAVSAGVVEEVLYRGYAVERLASLTGSYRLGAPLAVLAFGLAHLPAWGPGPALVATAGGALATAFYVWKRDLVALIGAHVAGDLLGLVLIQPTTG